jgi:hypothetical protein
VTDSTDYKKKDKLVKSKKRVADHGEVFTNEREVNAMLDLVKHETERIDSRFLEPACGNGNFLAEILRRKLNVVNQRYAKNQTEWEKNALIAVSSVYGVELLEDNAEECRERLFKIFTKSYFYNFGTNGIMDYLNSIKFIISRNILIGDALNFINPKSEKPIVFSEWSFAIDNRVKRRDFIFKFLVEQSHQFSLDFNDEGKPGAIDEPVQDFPLVHYLKLGQK